MVNISYRLSDKKDAQGNGEVILKLTINPHMRPTFRTGILINPQYFKVTKTSNHGSIMGIVPPRQAKLNFREVKMVTDAKNAVDAFAARISKLCQVALAIDKSMLTKEWLIENLSITSNMRIEDISIDNITKEKSRIEVEKKAKERLKNEKTIYEYAEMYLGHKSFSTQHKKAFRVLMRDLRRFELYIQKTKDKSFQLRVDTISHDDIMAFDKYLHTEYELAQKQPKLFKWLLSQCPKEVSSKHKTPKLVIRGENTIIKLKKKFKALFNWLIKNGYTTNNPFIGIEIGTERLGEPIYITLEERDSIAQHDFSNDVNMETQRDIFIFQCHVGCRVGDLIKLRPQNIVDDMLVYMPHKTKDHSSSREARVPLSNEAKRLIAKYNDKDEKGRLFPFISEQKYCEYIKSIFTECEIKRIVNWRDPKTGEYKNVPLNEIAASHLARKTFIGNIYKEIQDPNLIGKMTGHVEGSRAFARYRNIEDETLKKIITKVDTKSPKSADNDKEVTELFDKLPQETRIKFLSQMRDLIKKEG